MRPKSLNVTKALESLPTCTCGVTAERATGCAVCGGVRGPISQGLGTALKPSWEPIVVARKPLAGTVAGTVLAYGTGAINVDGCRVGTGEDKGVWPVTERRHADVAYTLQPTETDTTKGRWPANVVLDGAAADRLDQEVGDSRGTERVGPPGGTTFGGGEMRAEEGRWYGDAGGPSRFFPVFRYAAKAGADERPSYTRPGAGTGRVTGLGGKVRQCNVCETRAIESGASEPSCGHGDYRWEEPSRDSSSRVAHPTVKPLELMRWLVRLVTPPGGVVLDPFAGSGATLEAAVLEGFHAIGIEREPDYLPLIVQRLNRRQDPAAYLRGKAADDPDVDLGLFGLLDGDGAA